jgi:hypothetical protein
MSLYHTSGIELVKRVHRILTQKWFGGTCTGGGASTFIDTARTEPDDYFQNTTPPSRVKIISTTDDAAPKGQERTLSDWAVTTGTGTTTAAWTTANPGAGDTYCIMAEYNWDEILQAINDVFDLVKNKAVVEKQGSITLVAGVYEYAIPEGFTHIYRVSMADDAGSYPEEIDPAQYKIIRGAVQPMIHFTRFPIDGLASGLVYSGYFANGDLDSNTAMTDGREIRLEGLGYQATLLQDTDICYLNPMFVAYQAAALLHSRQITRIDTEPKGHQLQMQICQQLADMAKPQVITAFPMNTKRVV